MSVDPAHSADRLPEKVVGPRLTMRRLGHDDAPALAAAITASREHLRPWMGWIAFEPLTVPERVQWLEAGTRTWEEGGDVIYGVLLDGELVGGAGLHRRGGPEVLHIGYWVHVDHLRRGYASEVTASLTDAAFEIDGIDVVHCQTDEANIASAAVPAKLGFTPSHIIERAPEAPAESGRLIDWTVARADWRNPVRFTSG